MNIKISPGNAKLGAVPSISLPSGVTCRGDCECAKHCYAKRLERLRPNVLAAYRCNYDLLRTDPVVFWRETEAAVMMSRFFRFHVSGDIPDGQYLQHMVDIARRSPHCRILCFTKKYDIVNGYIRQHGFPPENLLLIFSAWRNLPMDNPYNLPEAHVRYRDGSTTASAAARPCGGNCTECALTDGGCWSLHKGEQVVFDEH